MKVKNKKNVVKAISAIGKTHKIKRNKIKRLTEKKGKKKKISKKALIEVGLKNDKPKPKAKVETTQPITNDNLIKLTNISYKGAPESSTPSLHKQQTKVDKTPTSFIKRMKDKLKGARFRYTIVDYLTLFINLSTISVVDYFNCLNHVFVFSLKLLQIYK